MRRVPIRLGPRSYEVRIGAGLLDRAGEELRALGFGERAFVASDTRVHRIYGPRLERSLRRAGFRAARFLM
ncbi:MAG: 3-dehydroquinate synthase, partial [Candidatus Latescibacterota bacterium]